MFGAAAFRRWSNPARRVANRALRHEALREDERPMAPAKLDEDYPIGAPFEVNVFVGLFSDGILDSARHSFTMGLNRSLGGCND